MFCSWILALSNDVIMLSIGVFIDINRQYSFWRWLVHVFFLRSCKDRFMHERKSWKVIKRNQLPTIWTNDKISDITFFFWKNFLICPPRTFLPAPWLNSQLQWGNINIFREMVKETWKTICQLFFLTESWWGLCVKYSWWYQRF